MGSSPPACDVPGYVHGLPGYPKEVHRDSSASARVTFRTSLTPYHVQESSALAILILYGALAVRLKSIDLGILDITHTFVNS